jgi:hypothetical protein
MLPEDQTQEQREKARQTRAGRKKHKYAEAAATVDSLLADAGPVPGYALVVHFTNNDQVSEPGFLLDWGRRMDPHDSHGNWMPSMRGPKPTHRPTFPDEFLR